MKKSIWLFLIKVNTKRPKTQLSRKGEHVFRKDNHFRFVTAGIPFPPTPHHSLNSVSLMRRVIGFMPVICRFLTRAVIADCIYNARNINKITQNDCIYNAITICLEYGGKIPIGIFLLAGNSSRLFRGRSRKAVSNPDKKGFSELPPPLTYTLRRTKSGKIRETEHKIDSC